MSIEIRGTYPNQKRGYRTPTIGQLHSLEGKTNIQLQPHNGTVIPRNAGILSVISSEYVIPLQLLESTTQDDISVVKISLTPELRVSLKDINHGVNKITSSQERELINGTTYTTQRYNIVTLPFTVQSIDQRPQRAELAFDIIENGKRPIEAATVASLLISFSRPSLIRR